MAGWINLKEAVSQVIKTNGNQEITGQILQDVLTNIISNVGENATFVGIAIPTTSPGAPDGPVFYLATQKGVYSNFDGIEIDTGIAIILWDGESTWLKYQVLTISQELGNNENIAMSQKVITELFNSLAATVWPLVSSFSATPSIIEYTGQAQEVTLNWTIKRKGENIAVTGLTIKQGSSTIYSGTENPGNKKVNANTKGPIRYDLSATAEGLTVTDSVTINMVLPMYFGFSAATSADSLTITDLAKQTIKAGLSGTYTLSNDTDGKYMWFCVPDTMGINRVTLNGFDVPMEGPQNKSTTLGTYKCYRNSNALIKGSYTIILS